MISKIKLFGTKNRGFTLIEVMMVLAISSLLALILIGQYSRTQESSRFTDAMERINSKLDKVKTETNSSFTTSPTGAQSGGDTVFFGKMVGFSRGSSTIRVALLTAPRQATTPPASQPLTVVETVNIPWGVTLAPNPLNSSDFTVIYTRDVNSGILNTSVVPLSLENAYAQAFNTAYDTGPPTEASLRFVGGNLNGTVTINRQSGEIKRTFDN